MRPSTGSADGRLAIDRDGLSSPSAHNAEPRMPCQESDRDREASEQNDDVEKQYERPRYQIALIMLSLCLAVFLAALDITIITTALLVIAADFDSRAAFTWIGSSYLLASAASTLVWGKLCDIFGRKPALLLANLFFFIGSLVAALAINVGMLLSARAIQGAGAGGLITLSNISIGDLFSPRRRGAYYGIIGGVWVLQALTQWG